MKGTLSLHRHAQIRVCLAAIALGLLLAVGLFAPPAFAQTIDPRVREVVRKLQRHHMRRGVERSPAAYLARELEAMRHTLYRVAASSEAGGRADEAELLQAHLTQLRLHREEMAARLPRSAQAQRRHARLESRFVELEGEVERVLEATDPVRRGALARDLIRRMEESHPHFGSRRLGDDLPTSTLLEPVDVIPPDVVSELRELQARRRAERATASGGR